MDIRYLRSWSNSASSEATVSPRTDWLLFLIMTPFLPSFVVGWVLGTVAGRIMRRIDGPGDVPEHEG